MPIRSRSAVRLLLAVCLGLYAMTVWSFGDGYNHLERGSTRYRQFRELDSRSINNPSSISSNDVVLVMKTGATEAFEKLPAHLDTTFSAVKNRLVFSDAKDDIGGVHLIDAFASANETLRNSHPAFALYREQQALADRRGNLNSLRGNRALELDQFKYPHILAQTWSKHPRAKWYIFIEADTYVFWSGLLKWLKKFDSSQKFYMGAAVNGSRVPFAHGGAGFVISHGAMAAAVGSDPRAFAAKYEELALKTAGGELLVGQAMADAGVSLLDASPSFGIQSIENLEFGEGNWLHEVFTLHRVRPEAIQEFWNFEHRLDSSGYKGPITHGMIFEQFIYPFVYKERDEWDNLASEKRIPIWVDTLEDALSTCRTACWLTQGCLSYRIQDAICDLSTKMSLGRRQTGVPRNRSGWMMMRTQALRRFGRLEDFPEHPNY